MGSNLFDFLIIFLRQFDEWNIFETKKNNSPESHICHHYSETKTVVPSHIVQHNNNNEDAIN